MNPPSEVKCCECEKPVRCYMRDCVHGGDITMGTLCHNCGLPIHPKESPVSQSVLEELKQEAMMEEAIASAELAGAVSQSVEGWEKRLLNRWLGSQVGQGYGMSLTSVKDFIRQEITRARQEGMKEGQERAVDYINTNLMWSRSKDKLSLEIYPEHIAEVLESARQV